MIFDDGTKEYLITLGYFCRGFVAIEEFSGTIQDNAEAIGEES